MNFSSHQTPYKLCSLSSGKIFDDEGWTLDAPGEEKTGLIRAIYENQQFSPKGKEYGLYTYADWLPLKRMLHGSSAPVTYRSEQLAKILKLKKLYITFSGWWPEKGAAMISCSFKETEAYSVCARMSSSNNVLVVASAGNTARAFAQVCSANNIPLLLCVPQDNLDALWFHHPLNPCVKLISTKSGSDYYDAINLSNLVAAIDGFMPEGGAKNIARRDGMGTTVLSAVEHIGRLPDYYFQAVGSGTGAIAAWEANLRLLGDGRYGTGKMKLMLSQNSPFKPIYDAWNIGSRNLPVMSDDIARTAASQIIAKVLSNRRPPYAVKGGLFDALTDTKGKIYAISNSECVAAAELFERTEGIDLHPAAAVATASLIKSVKAMDVDPDSVIMLNITGGGEKRFKQENPLFYLEPSLVFDFNPPLPLLEKQLMSLYA